MLNSHTITNLLAKNSKVDDLNNSNNYNMCHKIWLYITSLALSKLFCNIWKDLIENNNNITTII